jgi:hypothetical protein
MTLPFPCLGRYNQVSSQLEALTANEQAFKLATAVNMGNVD